MPSIKCPHASVPLLLAIAALLLMALPAAAAEPTDYVGTETCLECHDEG